MKPARSVALRVDHGRDRAVGERLLEDLVVPERLVVRVEEDVRVRVDEAGQERHARQVDRARPRRARSPGSPRPTAAIFCPVTRTTQPSWASLAGPVEHPRRPEEQARLGRRRGRRGSGERRLGPAENGEKSERRDEPPRASRHAHHRPPGAVAAVCSGVHRPLKASVREPEWECYPCVPPRHPAGPRATHRTRRDARVVESA